MVRGGELIKHARKARGMTQEEVAFSYGRSLSTIKRWEQGQSPVSFDDVVWVVTDLLKITITEVMELAANEKH